MKITAARQTKVKKSREETTDGGIRDLFKLLCRDISKYKLLSHEETMTLILQAQEIKAHNDAIDEKIRELKAKNSQSKLVLKRLERLEKKKAPNLAMQKIWACNLRLVLSIAKRFYKANHFISLEELVSIGSKGLHEAVSRFDVSKGLHFSTYATYWVIHKIKREMQNKSHIVRIPIHRQNEKARFDDFEKRMSVLGIKVDLDWPAPPSVILPEVKKDEKKKAEPKTIRQIEEEIFLVGRHPLAIDTPVWLGSDKEVALENILSDTTTPLPDARVELLYGLTRDFDNPKLAIEKLMKIAGLNEIQKYIIFQRFGINDGEERTLEEIGKKYKLSRERVRQIQESAMKKLRSAAEKSGRM